MTREIIRKIKDVPDFVTDKKQIITNTTTQINTTYKKGLLKIVQNFVPDDYTYTATTVRPGTEVVVLRTSIVTNAANSKIEFDLVLGGEVNQNTVFVLQRVVGAVITELGSANSTGAGTRLRGFASATYDSDVASTPSQLVWKFIDSPNASQGTTIQYRILFHSNATNILYLNRSAAANTTYNYERCSSNVLLSEYGV